MVSSNRTRHCWAGKTFRNWHYCVCLLIAVNWVKIRDLLFDASNCQQGEKYLRLCTVGIVVFIFLHLRCSRQPMTVQRGNRAMRTLDVIDRNWLSDHFDKCLSSFSGKLLRNSFPQIGPYWSKRTTDRLHLSCRSTIRIIWSSFCRFCWSGNVAKPECSTAPRNT